MSDYVKLYCYRDKYLEEDLSSHVSWPNRNFIKGKVYEGKVMFWSEPINKPLESQYISVLGEFIFEHLDEDYLMLESEWKKLEREKKIDLIIL